LWSIRGTWQNDPFTNKHTEQHKKVEHQDATEHLENEQNVNSAIVNEWIPSFVSD